MQTKQASDLTAQYPEKPHRPVLRSLMVPLTSAMLLLVGSFATALWWMQERRLEDSFTRSIATLPAAFQMALVQEADGLVSTLKAIALNRDLTDALRVCDARRLFYYSRPLFEQLQNEHGMTHFYFLDPDRICLLRVHMPEENRDRIDRFTAREAERTGKVSSGIELGPLGTFTLRAVLPVFNESTLVGYIELGKEIENVLRDLHREVGLELAITIRKDALHRENWEKGMAMLGRDADWDRFPNVALIYSSPGSFPSELDLLVTHHNHKPDQTKQEVALNSKASRTTAEKLNDASGQEVGDLIIIQDVSAQKAAFIRLISIEGGILAVVIALMFGFLFSVLNRTDHGILKQEIELRQSKESYRLLFEQMNSGFVLHELIYDSHAKPCDYRFLEVNPAFEKLTGLDANHVVGKRLLEVLPNTERSLIERYGRVASTGEPIQFEEYSNELGKFFDVRAFRPSQGHFAVTFHDITARKKAEDQVWFNHARLRSLVNILKQSAERIQDFLDFALHEAVKLTGSKIGYIYHYDEERKQFVLNTWTKEVMKVCTVTEAQMRYELDKTGFWGEAVRQRKPIILNDFQAEHPLKKGYPEGHVMLYKFMTVPVFKGDHIAAVVGVANKESDYDEADLLQLMLLMDSVYKVVELKQAEEALRESEARYRLLYEQAPMPYQSLDEDGNFIEVNAALLTALGYTRQEVIGRNFSEFLQPEWVKHFKNNFPKFKVVGEILGVEFEMLKKDGSTILVWFNGRIARDQQGQFIRTHCIFTDITERRKVEKALQQSEERLREAQKIARIGRWELDLLTNKLMWSESIFDLFEIDPREFKASYEAFLDAIHPSDRDMVDQAYTDSVKNKTPFEVSHRLLMKDGRIKWVNEICRTDYDGQGKPLRSIGTVQDISLLKLTEEQTRDSEERHRRLVEASTDAILVRAGELITYANPAALKIFHAKNMRELIGKRYLDLVHPEDRAESAERVRKSIDENWTTPPREHRILALDGQEVHVESTGVPVKYGSETQIFGVFRDITMRKKAYQEKEKLEGQLRQVQKMEAIGTLAGGIAHDFNNILSVIIGNSEMLAAGGEAPISLEEGINQILTASQRAKQLVSQILSFSRQGEQQRLLINLKPVVKETLGFLRSSLPTTIQLRHYIKPDAETIIADPTQMQQILMNLCTNAAHAMEERGGVLKIDLDNATVTEEDGRLNSGIEPGNYVRLTVSDTGHGMEPSVQARIFDPYFTTKGPGKGTGLGLSVVHGIVKSHGGMIKVYSEVGKGTTFKVFLPRADGVEEAEPKKAQVLLRGSEKILLIDDETALGDLGKRMLGFLGYQVEVRTSPIEALELFRVNPERFDAVITDMTMPQMTGLNLARDILAIRQGIPIILCTGFSDQANEAKAHSAGIRAFLFKPLVIADLANVVRKVLDKK